MKCIICNKIELVNRQKKYCSRKCQNKNGNFIHQSYKSQQKRGLDRKKKLIQLLGNKCNKCGYSNNYGALQFHHINPIQKSGRLDMRRLSNSTWEYCESEAKKCELLCSNCHAEHHYPHLTISKNI